MMGPGCCAFGIYIRDLNFCIFPLLNMQGGRHWEQESLCELRGAREIWPGHLAGIAIQ